MAGITKQTVFMLTLYVVLIIIMYSLVGININSGSEKDKKIPWLLYSFSFIGALGCFFALKKFNGGFKHKLRIIAYSIFLFAVVTAALILSKPTETDNFKIFTYFSIALVFVINLIAGIYLIDSNVKIIPSFKFNNQMFNKLTNMANTPGISPTQSTQSIQPSQPSQPAQTMQQVELPEYSTASPQNISLSPSTPNK